MSLNHLLKTYLISDNIVPSSLTISSAILAGSGLSSFPSLAHIADGSEIEFSLISNVSLISVIIRISKI